MASKFFIVVYHFRGCTNHCIAKYNVCVHKATPLTLKIQKSKLIDAMCHHVLHSCNVT